MRVLITGDVASEGVNLHKQCHHLVHVDIPWSLIRIEQRNGRIDRYGQLHPPQIVALALTTSDERFSGDVRVLTRLLAKEHAAHTALGDAASLLKLHDVEREEDAVRRALESGASTRRRRARSRIARRARLRTPTSRHSSPGSGSRSLRHRPWPTGRGCSTARSTSCASASTRRSPTRRAGPKSGGVGWAEHRAEDLVELVPPDDLMARLRCLPQSYLTRAARAGEAAAGHHARGRQGVVAPGGTGNRPGRPDHAVAAGALPLAPAPGARLGRRPGAHPARTQRGPGDHRRRRHARRDRAGDADQRPRPGGAAGARRHAVPRAGPAADRRPGRAGAAGGDRAARRRRRTRTDPWT